MGAALKLWHFRLGLRQFRPVFWYHVNRARGRMAAAHIAIRGRIIALHRETPRDLAVTRIKRDLTAQSRFFFFASSGH